MRLSATSNRRSPRGCGAAGGLGEFGRESRWLVPVSDDPGWRLKEWSSGWFAMCFVVVTVGG
jgi:hypothetical protein